MSRGVHLPCSGAAAAASLQAPRQSCTSHRGRRDRRWRHTQSQSHHLVLVAQTAMKVAQTMSQVWVRVRVQVRVLVQVLDLVTELQTRHHRSHLRRTPHRQLQSRCWAWAASGGLSSGWPLVTCHQGGTLPWMLGRCLAQESRHQPLPPLRHLPMWLEVRQALVI